jgi:DNA mismatch repair ATPase MutS
MKVLLMFRDRDFDPHQSLRHWPSYRSGDPDPRQQLLPHQRALIQDLELDTLLSAMAGRDEFLFKVADQALRSAFQNDLDTILYRQGILKDSLQNPEVIRQLYALAVEALEATKRRFWDLSSHYPSSVLYSAIDLLEILSGMLKQLRGIAEEHADRFTSEGFTTLFEMLRRELSDEYLAEIKNHLTELKFPKGVLVNAELGEWNESTNYVLHDSTKEPNWFERLLGNGPPRHTFHLHPRDEAGARILSDMKSRATSRVTVALAESADHVLSFFKALRTELAFYVGCLNLYARLAAKEEPVCFPAPAPAGERAHSFTGLYDVCLSLHLEPRVVGNAADANGKSLVIVTGANQGGKSTFLRSIGLAQLMMQCGMFVGAETFKAGLCPALFTHYKREEDETMKSGKLDEELARMSEIVDHIKPDSIVLFNESFSATNEREGSEIARQIVTALLEKRVKIFFVTHLYEFARALWENRMDSTLFLRAERQADGRRTFKLSPGEPLQTSFGVDLYEEVFGGAGERVEPAVRDHNGL